MLTAIRRRYSEYMYRKGVKFAVDSLRTGRLTTANLAALTLDAKIRDRYGPFEKAVDRTLKRLETIQASGFSFAVALTFI